MSRRTCTVCSGRGFHIVSKEPCPSCVDGVVYEDVNLDEISKKLDHIIELLETIAQRDSGKV